MEKLTETMDFYVEALAELQKLFMGLETHEQELIDENSKLKSEMNVLRKQIKELKQYAPHYKPGDIVTIKRLYPIGESPNIEYRYRKKDYDKLAKILVDNNAFFVEFCSSPEKNYDIIEQCVKSTNVIGTVISYNENALTIKLYPEELIPEAAKKLLKTLTKQEFDEKIRISHKFVIDRINKTKKTADLDRIISCYLIDKEKEKELLEKRNETL